MKTITIFAVICLLLISAAYMACGEDMDMEQVKLTQLKPQFRAKVSLLLLQARKRWPDKRIIVAEAYRTQARQDELFKKGPTVTMVKVSKHTKGLAADIYFVNCKRILKYEEAPYLELGQIGEGLGLRWGGRWKSPFDPGHFEARQCLSRR